MPAEAPILLLDDDPDVGLAAQLLLNRRVAPVTCLRRPAELPAALDRLAEASRRIRAALVGLEGLAGSAAPPPRRAPVLLERRARAHQEPARRTTPPSPQRR